MVFYSYEINHTGVDSARIKHSSFQTTLSVKSTNKSYQERIVKYTVAEVHWPFFHSSLMLLLSADEHLFPLLSRPSYWKLAHDEFSAV